jgi:CheY-like chemotaxis protein
MTSVLVIDDDTDICEYIQTYLESFDYKVLIANNGDEGLRIIRAHFPDIIILDIHFPGKSGIDILRSIKAKEEWEDIPVIMVTRDTKRETVLKCVRLGAIDYVVKPITAEGLLSKIKKTSQILDLQRKSKIKSFESRIDVKRSSGMTTLTFLGIIEAKTVQQFKSIYTERFQKMTTYDEYIIDLRFQPHLQYEQIFILSKILEILFTRKPRILAGRNYAGLLQVDLDYENQLFIAETDLERWQKFQSEKKH